MGLPGLRRRRPRRLHRARPGRGARRFLVDVLGCEYLYSLGPFATTTADWMAEHLNVHPRAVMRRTGSSGSAARRSSRCSTTTRPTSNATRRATATSAATTSPSTSTTWTPPSPTCAPQGVRGPRRADREQAAPHEGQRWVYFLTPWGMQFELVSLPGRQGVLPQPAEAFA